MSDYSRGDYADLPAGTTDLENNYSAPDLTAIASNDNSTYAEQTANNEIAIHQYKKTVTAQYTNIVWSGKSSLAPSESPVIMEVYNVDLADWEELDRDDSTAADTDFDLSYDNLATADYLDTGVITWRVYQASSAEITYLLNDTFTTALGAGEVNDTAPEPGPGGNRAVTDTTATILPAGTANLKGPYSGFSWSYPALTRALGQTFFTQLATTVGSGAPVINIGLGAETIRLDYTPVTLAVLEGGKAVLVGSPPATGESALYAIVQRAYGNFWFYQAPGTSNWILVYVTDISNTASLAPGYSWTYSSSSSSATSAYIKVASSWWPLPVASDSFPSSFGTTNGLGHQGANNSGEGTAGDGLSWSARNGTWTVSSGAAKGSLLAALNGYTNAIATVATSYADVVMGLNLSSVGAASNIGFVLRYSDNDNMIAGFTRTGDSGYFALQKCVTGTWSEIAHGYLTHVDGARLVVRTIGSSIMVSYGDVNFINATNSFNASATNHGIYTEDATSAVLDNFWLYPSGTGGEYNTDLNNLLGE